MKETDEELTALQTLLDRSHAGASDHLKSIIDDGRTLSAREIAGLMTGMRVMASPRSPLGANRGSVRWTDTSCTGTGR